MKIYNTAITEAGNKVFNLKAESMPDEIAPFLQPVLETRLITRTLDLNNTGTTTDKPYLLLGISIAGRSDTASDFIHLVVARGNETIRLLTIGLSATANTGTHTTAILRFPFEVKSGDRFSCVSALGGVLTYYGCIMVCEAQ